MSKLLTEVDIVKKPWELSPFYEEAERWTFVFWNDGTPFYEQFKKLDLTHVVELGCGWGRHSEIIAKRAKYLTLVDVFESNLSKCRQRLSSYENVKYILGNGYDYTGIDDNSVTAIISYDTMVHFSMDLMFSYLKDTSRILKQNGLALYHHSNFRGPGADHYGKNPGARNIMDFDLFVSVCQNVGLRVMDSQQLNWGGIQNLDRLTLLCKI
jgi:cyclopropane fatty-acyl-phospholipid synthase-like methyltransferase